MTEKERNAIRRLTAVMELSRDPSKDEGIKKRFLKELGLKAEQLQKYLLSLLLDSYKMKNADDIWRCLFVGCVFDLYSNDFMDVLCNLLEEDWHYKHEDIAHILQGLKNPDSVNSLYKAAITNHQYLAYSDVEPLAVKCIWALGDINTEAAREKLKLLSKSDNEIIRKNALKQLRRPIGATTRIFDPEPQE